MYQKMKFLDQSFQKLEHKYDRQTDTQTDETERTTIVALAGDSNHIFHADIYIHCVPKNAHIFIFLITRSNVNQF